MRFIYTDGGYSDFIELCRCLDEFLNELVGGEENRAEYIPYNQLEDIHDVIVAYDDDVPVGSAGFKKYDDECAEVKRVFVKQAYRGKGISNKLMELLENAARKQGYYYLILDLVNLLLQQWHCIEKLDIKLFQTMVNIKICPIPFV